MRESNNIEFLKEHVPHIVLIGSVGTLVILWLILFVAWWELALAIIIILLLTGAVTGLMWAIMELTD
jgi:hypothetical protein